MAAGGINNASNLLLTETNSSNLVSSSEHIQISARMRNEKTTKPSENDVYG